MRRVVPGTRTLLPMRLVQRMRLLRADLALGDLLEQLATVHGGRRLVEQPEPILLTGGSTQLTFAEAADVVARAAEVLAAQCHGGRRVVVRGPNDYGFFLTCLAVARAGGVVVPVNPRMRDDEVAHVIADAEAEVVDVDALDRELAASDVQGLTPAQPRRGDVAGIFYTSGTTGRPKGARLTDDALTDPANLGALWPAGLRRDEFVVSLPIAHIMGFAALVGVAGTGIPVYFLPRFDADAVLDAIEGRRATAFIGVPAMFRMLLDAGAADRDLTSIRCWVSGADVMPADLARAFKKFGATATLPMVGRPVGEAMFAQGYGAVETGGAVSAKVSPPGLEIGLGDVLGWSLFGWRMRVVDDEGAEVPSGEVGELLVKGPGILRGYHGDDAATRQVLTDDGWVRTGDLARKDRVGLVHFAGRKKDVLMHGGYSVYPPEVEETLRLHPGVADAAVVGRIDEVKGQVPVAFVVAAPGVALDADELVTWARERISGYKAPREVHIVDALPRTGTGKVAKTELRDRLAPG